MEIKEKIIMFFNKKLSILKKFPATIIAICLYTIFTIVYSNQTINHEIISEQLFLNVTVSLTLFASWSFAIEAQTQTLKKRILNYVLAFFVSADIAFVNQYLVSNTKELILYYFDHIYYCACTLLTIYGVFSCYKNSNMKLDQYVSKTIIALIKALLISFGVLVCAYILYYVIEFMFVGTTKLKYIDSVISFVIGFVLTPLALNALVCKEKKISNYAKQIAQKVIIVLSAIVYVLVYAYIIKQIIDKKVVNNMFVYIMYLFIYTFIVVTLSNYFSKGKDNKNLIEKIIEKIPYAFIPLILIQVYYVAFSIDYGLNPYLYLYIMVAIFEIIYILLYIFRKEQLGKLIYVLAVMVVVTLVAPIINMYTLSNLSHLAIVNTVKENKELTATQTNSYYYLQSNVVGRYLIDHKLTDVQKDKFVEEPEEDDPISQEDIEIFTAIEDESVSIEGCKTFIQAATMQDEVTLDSLKNTELKTMVSDEKIATADLSNLVSKLMETKAIIYEEYMAAQYQEETDSYKRKTQAMNEILKQDGVIDTDEYKFVVSGISFLKAEGKIVNFYATVNVFTK